MKKLLLSLTTVVLMTGATTAQVGTAPVLGFEAWHAIAPPLVNAEDPNGWASLNALNGFTATPLSVTKETASPAGGTITAKITTVQVQGATIPSPYGGNLDTAGILAIGSVALASPPSIKYGFTYSAKPSVLSFKSKYSPMPGDSAFVLAYLTRWNTASSTRDTIASGRYATGAATSTYSINSLTMNYDAAFAGVSPDTQQVFVSSSVYSHDGAKVGSTFWIDDLMWSAFVGVDEADAVNNTVTVYPNPAASYITVKSTVNAASVQVIDVTGRIIGSHVMSSNMAEIGTGNYASGIYTYIVLDENNLVINRGKFEVAH